jgi:hypothetical protein
MDKKQTPMTIPASAPALLAQRYRIYLACADNGKGIDITTGKPLKTFDQWVTT